MQKNELLKHNTLCLHRELLSLTQTQISTLLHISHDAVSTYESGRSAPSLLTALGIELIFGASLAQLYPSAARAVAERMIPALQKQSIAAEWYDADDADAVRGALSAIGDRLSSLIPLA